MGGRCLHGAVKKQFNVGVGTVVLGHGIVESMG